MKLITKYFSLLLEGTDYPNAICFYTDGARLVCNGSPVLDILSQLEQKGVRLIVCSTCLEEMNLKNNLQVGIVGGMADILEAQIKAEKVITL
ncbi:MAG: DsrE family protein [Chloroflexi bacterium]|nr:DsrE family protein [Chloroflexota bacterium]